MIVSPNGQRFLRIVVAVCAVIIATLVIVDHLRLARLTRTSPSYASHTDVRALQQHLDAVGAALARLQHIPPVVTQTTFDATRQAVDARLAKLEQLASATATADAMSALDARVHQLETRVTASTEVASKTTIAQHHRSQVPIPHVPPFAILGEEQRGGQTFLVIAPSHWQAADDVQLLQPGDRQGDWQLESLDGDTATFRIDGQMQHLPIR